MKHRKDWHQFERVYVELNPTILRIIDFPEMIIWINTSPRPGANVIRLRQ